MDEILENLARLVGGSQNTNDIIHQHCKERADMIRQYVEMAKADIESLLVDTNEKIGGWNSEEATLESAALENLKDKLKVDDKFTTVVLEILQDKDDVWSLESNPSAFEPLGYVAIEFYNRLTEISDIDLAAMLPLLLKFENLTHQIIMCTWGLQVTQKSSGEKLRHTLSIGPAKKKQADGNDLRIGNCLKKLLDNQILSKGHFKKNISWLVERIGDQYRQDYKSNIKRNSLSERAIRVRLTKWNISQEDLVPGNEAQIQMKIIL